MQSFLTATLLKGTAHLLFAATECNFPSHAPDVGFSGTVNPDSLAVRPSAEN